MIHNYNAELFRGSTFPVKIVVSKFTNCDDSEYTYDMGGYFGQDAQSATGNMKATHTKLLEI